jgi:hypothetical protein
VVGYRPQLARSGSGFVTAVVLPWGNTADSPHLVPMLKEQITNTGVIPSMASKWWKLSHSMFLHIHSFKLSVQSLISLSQLLQ